MIRVTLNDENVQRAEVLMKSCPKIVQRAAVSAINRTITSTRAEISKAVRGRYAVKAADVKKALSLTRAKGQSPRGVITASGSPLSLTKFSLRRRKRGPIRVRVLRNGELKPVSGLFFNRFRSGYTGPMHRRQKARYPLASPFGPSVPSMVGNEETLNQFIPKAEKVLNERFLHEIRWRLDKK